MSHIKVKFKCSGESSATSHGSEGKGEVGQSDGGVGQPDDAGQVEDAGGVGEPDPPDGGWGWVVALGAALVQMQVERSMADGSALYHPSLPLQCSLSEA